MVCSNCGSQMVTTEVLDKFHEVIKLDNCANCGSFSLGQYELSRLDNETVEAIDVPFNSMLEKEDHPLDCPHCNVPMKISKQVDHNNTNLQICNECQNIFIKKGHLARYFGIFSASNAKLPDTAGIFSSRDRILTGIIATVILLFGAGLTIWKQTSFGSFYADSILSLDNTPAPLFNVIFICTILLFIIGLILSFSRQNRIIRLLGWSTVLLSIALIFSLSI